jgi:hypothetical protein
MKKFGGFAIFLGTALVITSFFTPTYEDVQLTLIRAKLRSVKNTDYRGEHIYALTLYNYKSTFEIENNYYSFKKDLFEKTVKKGDSIAILVPKDFKNDKGEVVHVFEVSQKNSIFLKKVDSLSDFKTAYKVVFYLGIGVLVLGTVVFSASALIKK